MISFRGHAQRRIFRMASASQMKWKSCTAWFSKVSALIATLERVKDLSQRCCYVSSRFFKWVYGNPWPWLVGIRRIPAYHVNYTTDLQNPLWDWARIASALVTFYSTKSLSIKRRCSLLTDPPIITQKPGVQASPLLHSPPETLSIRGGT